MQSPNRFQSLFCWLFFLFCLFTPRFCFVWVFGPHLSVCQFDWNFYRFQFIWITSTISIPSWITTEPTMTIAAFFPPSALHFYWTKRLLLSIVVWERYQIAQYAYEMIIEAWINANRTLDFKSMNTLHVCGIGCVGFVFRDRFQQNCIHALHGIEKIQQHSWVSWHAHTRNTRCSDVNFKLSKFMDFTVNTQLWLGFLLHSFAYLWIFDRDAR